MLKKRKTEVTGQLSLLLIAIAVGTLSHPYAAEAAIVNYSGDEAGFQTAIAGLPQQPVIDFEDLTEGEIITNQYLPKSVLFSTIPGYPIVASPNGAGAPPHDGQLCANVDPSPANYSEFTFTFPQPVLGTSLWVLDKNYRYSVDVSIFDGDSNQIGFFSIGGDLGYQVEYFLGFLSDSANIARVDFAAVPQPGHVDPRDQLGFDTVTVVPEPATLSLLLFGGLVALKRRR